MFEHDWLPEIASPQFIRIVIDLAHAKRQFNLANTHQNR
jgi:hypothetical protein